MNDVPPPVSEQARELCCVTCNRNYVMHVRQAQASYRAAKTFHAWAPSPESIAAFAEKVAATRVEEERLGCGGCGGPHRFDTSVPSALWNRVIRAQGLSDYLCTSCIVRAFAASGVSFTATLWGDGFNGLPLAVEINGEASTAAHELGEENNQLRATLISIHDCARAALDRATAPRAPGGQP